MPFWECIVVNDGPKPLELPAHPWARVINPLIPLYDEQSTYASLGAGAARNKGLEATRSPLVLFLDADDVIVPRALETLLRSFVESGGAYAYSDWLTLEDETRIDGAMEVRTVEDYDQHAMLRGLRHAVTALVPTDWVRSVGGFDEQLKGFEDWDLFCKLAIVGYCGVRVAQPLLIYRRETGMRTRTLLKARTAEEQGTPAYTPLGEQTAAALYDRYAAYLSGEEPIMACGTCGGQSAVVADAQQALNSMLGFASGGVLGLAPDAIPESGSVRMEFVGQQRGEQTYIGKASGRVYRAGRDPVSRFHDVDPRDVEHLLALELFRVVPPELLAQAAQAEDVPMVAQVAQSVPRGRKR